MSSSSYNNNQRSGNSGGGGRNRSTHSHHQSSQQPRKNKRNNVNSSKNQNRPPPAAAAAAPPDDDNQEDVSSTLVSSSPAEAVAQEQVNNNLTTTALNMSSSMSNNSDSSGNTTLFNTADEFEDEPSSVVNASMVVNLSNANLSFSQFDDSKQELSNSPAVLGGSGIISSHNNKQDKIDLWEGDWGGGGSGSGVTPMKEEEEEQQQEEVEKENVQSESVNLGSVVTAEATEAAAGDNDGTSSQQQQQLPSSSSSPPEKSKSSGSCSASSSSESTTLADSEVANLMSSAGPIGGGGGSAGGSGNKLPNTVSVLTAPNGVQVYLVGTAHFSLQSQDDVVQTIRMARPTLVLLELCSSRKNILTLDEETVLKEVSEMSFQKVRLALSNSGTVQGTLHLLLLSMSAQLTKKLGMAPGGEFRAAMREAKQIPGCVLLLGDRPFNITISRALAALTFFQKIKLAWQFLTTNEDITREEIEKCKEKDLLERMLTEMTGEFPSITEVFVNERDVYLAHSLFLAATSEAHRSNGGPIVGVVGMGHVPGIVRNWGKTTDEIVGSIIRIPETPLSTLIMRKTLKLVLYSTCAYGVYRVGSRLFAGHHSPWAGSIEVVKGWWVRVGSEFKRF